MNSYDVFYRTESSALDREIFRVQADDFSHAIEQTQNAHPACEILAIHLNHEGTRFHKYAAALRHWQSVGYSWDTARALAAVLHGVDDDVKAWAKNIMLTQTNLHEEDMI
jgi:hypothetical protein